MTKKNLDELTDIEEHTVQEFIKTLNPALGIESVQFFSDGAFVVFKD